MESSRTIFILCWWTNKCTNRRKWNSRMFLESEVNNWVNNGTLRTILEVLFAKNGKSSQKTKKWTMKWSKNILNQKTHPKNIFVSGWKNVIRAYINIIISIWYTHTSNFVHLCCLFWDKIFPLITKMSFSSCLTIIIILSKNERLFWSPMAMRYQHIHNNYSYSFYRLYLMS